MMAKRLTGKSSEATEAGVLPLMKQMTSCKLHSVHSV